MRGKCHSSGLRFHISCLYQGLTRRSRLLWRIKNFSNVRKYQTEMETNFHGAKTGTTASGYWASHPLLAIVDDQMKRPTTH